jgi:hypothetical protein
MLSNLWAATCDTTNYTATFFFALLKGRDPLRSLCSVEEPLLYIIISFPTSLIRSATTSMSFVDLLMRKIMYSAKTTTAWRMFEQDNLSGFNKPTSSINPCAMAIRFGEKGNQSLFECDVSCSGQDLTSHIQYRGSLHH